MKSSPFSKFEAALAAESPSRSRSKKPAANYAAITMPPDMKEGLKQLAARDLRTLAGYCREQLWRHLSEKRAKPVERPDAVGFYWWRPDDGASWQILEVRAEGSVLYVLCDDLNLYQCDDIAKHPWYGEWWPVKLQPPAK